MATQNLKAIERYRENLELIFLETNNIDFNETTKQKKDRINRLLSDYGEFVNYYFPHYAKSKTAKFQIQAANRILKDKGIVALAEWARGHAKSTHFDVFIPMWLKALKELHVMVLVGKSGDNACVLLSDIQAEFESNQRYIHDFGIQMRVGNWEDGHFVTRDDCAFFALGRGQSPRGLRHRDKRPDYIVVDDIDDDEICQNVDRVNKLYNWLFQALYFSMDMGRGRFVVVGNRISKNSIVAKMADRDKIYHQKVNVLDAKGKPSWPEKYTLKEIQNIIEVAGSRNAQKELFNNPITEGSVFKQEWLRFGRTPKLSEFDSIVSYCDPSFKSSSKSDFKAILIIGQKGTKIYVIGAFVRKCSIGEMVRWWYDFHESLPSDVIVDYWMEANFLQDMILDEFTAEGKTRGYQLPLRPDKRAKPDKFLRVEALSPLFERGFVIIDETLESNSDVKEFIDQLLAFEKGSRYNDDAPDAFEGAVWQLSRSTRKSNSKIIIHQRENRSY